MTPRRAEGGPHVIKWREADSVAAVTIEDDWIVAVELSALAADDFSGTRVPSLETANSEHLAVAVVGGCLLLSAVGWTFPVAASKRDHAGGFR